MMKRLNLMAGAASALSVAMVGLMAASGLGTSASADTTTTTTVAATTTTTLPGQTTTSTTVPGSTTTTTAPSSTTSTIPPTTTTTVTAQQILAYALVAVQGERGVKWTYLEAAGTESFTESVHAGVVDGTMTDTLHLAHSGAVKFSLHGRLFFQGTSYGLLQDLGFKTKFASKEAGKWISVSASSPLFLNQVAIMTVGGVAGMLDLVGAKTTVLPATTVRGVAVIPVQENVTVSGTKITQTVYIKAVGTHLPVQLIREFDGIEGVITYSSWGTPPHATAPHHATQFQHSWV